MKIDTSIKPGSSASVGETRSRTTGKTTGSAPSSNAADVQLSGLSAQLQSSGETTPFDAVRVSEIKQAIAEGRFTINAGAIADRLITSAKELVNSQRQT